jgi:hypothetical protein
VIAVRTSPSGRGILFGFFTLNVRSNPTSISSGDGRGPKNPWQMTADPPLKPNGDWTRSGQ